ncbi:MAG TPA: Gfo/Idh/MocA family oxidoreductase [Blastocatellia bacterium]|nr:Gfo/Idh/MocA family oxidoreductase [Blastocatellia bacterium]
MIRLGIIGTGYWGPNLVRNFAGLESVRIEAVCDLDQKRAESIRHRFCPDAKLLPDPHAVAASRDIDAVVISTPIQTHFDLGSKLLAAGKHVFVEKPLARTVKECEELIDAAERSRRVLMVGHVFEFNPAVQRIKQYLDSGELGKLFYVYSQRVNLGRIQHDVNALWSFAPHDVSIMNYWLGQDAVRVSARGFSYLSAGVEDVVYVTLEYPGGIGVNLHLAWLDPRKIRLMTLVGSKKMLVYDDVSLDAKIQLYDKGIAGLHDFLESPETFAEFQFQIRSGDLVVPALQFGEPLQNECRHFIECVEAGKQPLTDGRNGLRVVRVLEAAERSLREGGQPIDL